MKNLLLLILFFAPILSGAIEQEKMDALVLDFRQTEEKYDNLDAYHPKLKLTIDEKIEFAMKALDKLLDNPQKPSLKWGFKLSKIDIFLDGIDPDRIPLKYVPILFRSLKIGSLMPTGNVITIDLLDRIVGNSPGYTMQYLEGNNLSNAESLALIEKWEKIFKQNKEHILKKRYYKNKYFGKKVAN